MNNICKITGTINFQRVVYEYRASLASLTRLRGVSKRNNNLLYKITAKEYTNLQ